jgi:WhiB family redox-sensing transcriptional regulator
LIVKNVPDLLSLDPAREIMHKQGNQCPGSIRYSMTSNRRTAVTQLMSTSTRTTLSKGSTILMDWRNRAACLDEDPELFFPIGNTGPAISQIDEAKAVCRRCEVIDTCLKWALESGQDAGVWGGLSEDERRALKRRNARARRAG